MAAAIGLHALLIRPELWSGYGASADLAFVHFTPATLLFIDEEMSPAEKPPIPQVSLQGIRLTEIAVPDARLFDESPEKDEVRDASRDTETHPAKMSIILRKHYVAQVRAQINRIWELVPPLAADSDESRCVVRISQEPNGTIAGVHLAGCGNDESRMRLIEQAIISLSPLPQPIVPDLYVPELTVDIAQN